MLMLHCSHLTLVLLHLRMPVLLPLLLPVRLLRTVALVIVG